MKWCYCSSGRFGKSVLSGILDRKFLPDAVISLPDRGMGRKLKLRPVPVKEFCLDNSIAVVEAETKQALPGIIKGFDITVVCDFGIIFSEEALNSSYCINVHPSLLPRWRGPAPIYWTILSGDERTGVSIIEMTKELDSGPILLQRELPVGGKNYSQLSFEMSDIAATMLKEIFNGKNFPPGRQDDSLATYAGFVSKEHARINFGQDDIYLIDRKIRAFESDYGAYAFLNGKRFKIFKARPVRGKDMPLGRLEICGNKLLVGAISGALDLTEVQIEGKKRMRAAEFLQGYSKIISQAPILS